MKKSHKILFTLSIVLNLALTGVVVGHAVKRWQDAPWQEAQKDMSPQTRELMRKMFMEKREKIKATWNEMREKKKAMEAIIGAPEFDAQAFDTAVQDWQVFNTQATQGKMEAFKSVMAQLPQEERAKLAEKFVKVLTGTRDHKDGRSGDGASRWKSDDNAPQNPAESPQ